MLKVGRVLLMWALLQLRTVSSAYALLCNCTDPYQHCKAMNFTCEIDARRGWCATYHRNRLLDRQEYTCLSQNLDNASCVSFKNVVHVACCRSANFCNGLIELPKPIGPSAASPQKPTTAVDEIGEGKSSPALVIAMAISGALSTVMLTALITYVIYNRKKDAGRRTKHFHN